MRIGGLATGMDIDAIVKKLMTAERIPLDKMSQDKTLLEWKREGFRDINLKLSELDNMMLDMKLSKTYNSKTVTSSQGDAVTATGTSSASNGSYRISVSQLASSAIRVSQAEVEQDISEYVGETISFSTYDENGEEKEKSYTIKSGETLDDVLKRITDDDNNVRAFYDSQSKKVIMETTRTGSYNTNGDEIVFSASSSDVLQLGEETGGTDAAFEYNGVAMNSKSNSDKLNGITFEFKDVTSGGGANITISNDVDASFDKIMKFIDKYNEVIETLNDTQREETYRDFKPPTEEQKKGMSEDEIKLWEEKARSGILRRESLIPDAMFDMRRSWYSNVKTDGEYTSLTQLGLSTSMDYLDGGKIVFKDGKVDEDKLKEALRENPEAVMKLFSNSEEGAERGLVNRLEDSIEATSTRINERAGTGTDTLENYTIGKRMKDLNERISSFENRLTQVETRYWRQFSAMEKAISRMNQQSSQLMSQFGGGM